MSVCERTAQLGANLFDGPIDVEFREGQRVGLAVSAVDDGRVEDELGRQSKTITLEKKIILH